MITSNLTLNNNEKVVFNLRSLFNKQGYKQYKMSKFEEYDLYVRNKDFLISDSVITFTDTNGKLMALKPDVTLSIIKNTNDEPDTIKKVYYDENVYRISKGTNSFKEITQIGLESIGNIDNYNICEVITLAANSLNLISDSCVLDVSHLGIITALLNAINIPDTATGEVLKCISEKNPHELYKLCSDLGVSFDNAQLLKTIATTYGKPTQVLPMLKDTLSGIIDTYIIDRFSDILENVDDSVKDMIRVDFSVVSDTHYYNNIVFKGFVEGIPTSVLSGGQYDKLMRKMKRKSGAIGFAVYLDLLDSLDNNIKNYDVDTVLLYSSTTPLTLIKEQVSSLQSEGLSVYACTKIPSDLKYKSIIKVTECEVD